MFGGVVARRLATKRSPTYGGIDPGKDGFMVLYDGAKVLHSCRIPYLGNEIDLTRLLKILRAWRLLNCRLVHLEHQQPFGREGSKSSFTSGLGFGILKCALAAVGVRQAHPKPHEWKRDVGIPTAPRLKMPRLPKKPKGAKGRLLTTWKIRYSEVERKRGVIQRAKSTKIKELACRRAQELSPGYDFRVSSRATKPHNGKCEAFLLSVLAYRVENRAAS